MPKAMLLGVTPDVVAGRLTLRPPGNVIAGGKVGAVGVAPGSSPPPCETGVLLKTLCAIAAFCAETLLLRSVTSLVVAPVIRRRPLGLIWKPAMPSFAPSS